jgi:hypothetical protein
MDRVVEEPLRQRVLSELMQTYPELEKIFRETDRRRYLMIDTEIENPPAIKRSVSANQSDMSIMKVYPDLNRSAAYSFARTDRGLLFGRRSGLPGPGFYDPRKSLLSSSRYSFGRSYRPLSDPLIAPDRNAVKTDFGRLSPGPVYTKYTSLPIVHRLISM